MRLPRLIGRSRALDLILTGRSVDAREAHAIVLVNRVVPEGQALGATVALATELSSYPQACLRSDRAALYDAEGLPELDGLRVEFEHGRTPLADEARRGAARFVAGEGRHGRFAG